MQMGGLEKETAMRLFEGMQVQQDDEGISIKYLTVVPFFQVCCCIEHLSCIRGRVLGHNLDVVAPVTRMS